MKDKDICHICGSKGFITEARKKHGDYICQKCKAKRDKEGRDKNPEKYRIRAKNYYKSHQEQLKERIKSRRYALRDYCLKHIGSICVVCGSSEKICFHEIHGKRHEKDLSYVKNNSKDFIPLCSNHHNVLHMIQREAKNIEKIRELLASFWV